MPQLPAPLLCLVTDRKVLRGITLEEAVQKAVAGGCNLVQLREKDLPAGQLLSLAKALRAVTAGRALLFINDRVDVALACDADGVQLGEESLPVAAVRRIAGDRLLIGRSVHSEEGAVEAQRLGADLLIVGTMFETASHPGAVAAGTSLLRRVTSAVNVPILGIGGVTRHNVGQVMDAGACGVAVVREVLASPDPEASARSLMAEIREAWLSRTARARD
ncbi:MAG: thiamine phosphate synthase [Chloroflexi bacterium]|nr:thiamine phosphate synthase [Chloroflexota bacterium]